MPHGPHATVGGRVALTAFSATGLRADLAGLCELPRLRALDLRRTRVTDDGLRAVAELSGLRYLLLGGDAVTDAGLRHLEGMSGLRELDR